MGFWVKHNPTGLQEAILRSDKNSKTTLIIKSTLERSFLMKNLQKYHFWNIALFTRFNLLILQYFRRLITIHHLLLRDCLLYTISYYHLKRLTITQDLLTSHSLRDLLV